MNISPKEIWQFNYCNDFDLKQQTLQSFKSKGAINEDIIHFYEEIMQSAVHPSIIKSGLTSAEWSNVKNVVFNNIKVDINTIKILNFFLAKLKVVEIKFSNNNLPITTFDLIVNDMFTTSNNLYSFNFEWNNMMLNDKGDKVNIAENVIFKKDEKGKDIIDEDKQQIINAQNIIYRLFEPSPNNKLEAISLRGNYLGNKIISHIFDLLKNNTTLRVLNIYKNNLTSECANSFCQMVLFNRNLEEINLGGNSITDEFIFKIKDFMGEYEMTHEEVEEYENKVKEKEEIIAFNAKNKNNKKVELKEIPFVDEVRKEEDKMIKIRNNTLRKIDENMELFDSYQEEIEVTVVHFPEERIASVNKYDAYYGDPMPVMMEFVQAGKPVMIQNVQVY